MCLERISFLLEARSINRQMAGLAAIHSRHRLVEAVAVEFVKRNLLDLRDFEEAQGTELERHVLLDSDPLVPFTGHLAEFDLDFLGAGLDLFDLVL